MRTHPGHGSRRIGLGLLALFVAFLVLGIATDSAAAATRKDAVKESNDVIGYCHESENGTEAYTIEDDITVHCFLEGGGIVSCYWEAANDWVADCKKIQSVRPGHQPDRVPLDAVPRLIAGGR